jgi:mannose-6-phosphate isomerase-like protein (cupin superfamily)
MTSIRRNGMMLVVAASLGFAAAGLSRVGAEPAQTPTVDADLLARLVQSLDKVEKIEYPWGSIRWLMNAELDPQATMTLGIVDVLANQQNPAHVHATCDEILYIVSGSCEHRVGDKVVTLKAGDAMRVPKGLPHSAKTLGEPMRAVVVYDAGKRDFQVVE